MSINKERVQELITKATNIATDNYGSIFSKEDVIQLLNDMSHGLNSLPEEKESEPHIFGGHNDDLKDIVQTVRDYKEEIQDYIENELNDSGNYDITDLEFSIGYDNKVELDDYRLEFYVDSIASDITERIITQIKLHKVREEVKCHKLGWSQENIKFGTEVSNHHETLGRLADWYIEHENFSQFHMDEPVNKYTVQEEPEGVERTTDIEEMGFTIGELIEYRNIIIS